MRVLLLIVFTSFLLAQTIAGAFIINKLLSEVIVVQEALDTCVSQREDAVRAMRFHGVLYSICENGTWYVYVKGHRVDSINVYRRLSAYATLRRSTRHRSGG